jgi:hypothetical protein
MADIRYWTDENGWRRVDFNYFLTKTKGKMIQTVEDGEKDGRGVVLHLANGAMIQFMYEGDTFSVNYLTP